MSDTADAPQTVVPVKVPKPEDHAPPSLAEPASGPAAEMSGALHTDGAKPANTNSAEDTSNPNGDVPSSAQPEEKHSIMEAEQPQEQVADQEQDTDMKDATEAAAESSAPAATAETNGTPASKPKRKSSTGIPEHKTKTLKKKQSKAKLTNLDAQPGDYYLARLRSYPPWPSIICDEEMLPEVLLNSRPVTAMQPDGTYKEPYADGGKKVADRTYAVMFLYTNEFGWIPNTDLSPLTKEICDNVSEKGKAKALIEAYKVAAGQQGLQHYKDMLLQHEAALQEDEDRKAAKAAEKADKVEKKKRKSEVKVDEDIDMEDIEEDPPKKSSKKRKKEPESDDEEPEKPAKTPKPTKLKLTTGKTPQTSEKKTEKKTSKPKSEKKKKAQESEEEAEQEKEEQPILDPVEARKAREKEVLFLRHKLQKGFLTRDEEPKEEEMPQMGTYIKKLEALGDSLEVTIIRNTKINKVLKGIVKLNSIPKDEEYHFRERSVKLLGVWNQLLGAEPADADKSVPKEEKASPTTTNGIHKEAEAKAESKIDTKVEEPKDSTVSTEEAVEKTSPEVSADAGEKTSAIEAIQKDETQAAPTETAASAVEQKVADKAPESAAAAAEAAEVVKATE